MSSIHPPSQICGILELDIKMILLDSNVIIYAINLDSHKNQQAVSFIEEQIDNLCVAHQNIFEALRVLTHKKYENPMLPRKAIEAITAISDNLVTIAPNFESKFVALEIIKKTEITSNKIFDAYLVSTMLTNNVSEIATDNVKDFVVFSEVKVINPFK